jgi:hypothetical protein
MFLMDGESTSSYRYRTTCLAMHSSPEIRSCAACKAKSNPHPTKKDALLKAYAVRMLDAVWCVLLLVAVAVVYIHIRHRNGGALPLSIQSLDA